MDKTDKRHKYDEAFKAEALRLARESRSSQVAARALNIDPKRIYHWQRQAQAPLPADSSEAAKVRQLRDANRRLEQELEILIGVTQLVVGKRPRWLKCGFRF